MTSEQLAKLISSVDGYAYIKLGAKLHDTHKKVLRALFDNSKSTTKVSFVAANSTGKTSSVIAIAVLYALDIKNALVIATSATYRQCVTQMMPAIKKYSHLFKGWEFLENQININGEKRFICFSGENEGTIQGYHSSPNRPLVIILDEAATINQSVYAAFERCFPTNLLLCGSPLSPSGMFYDIQIKSELNKQFEHFKMTQEECEWIPKKQIQDFIARWGETHPLIKSSVFAEWSTQDQNSIITLSEWDGCINNPPEHISGERRVALDFAAGGDESVISYRNGNKCEFIKCWKDKDTMSTAGVILMELNKLKNTTGLKQDEVWGDASGLGKPILDKLYEEGWHCNYYFNQCKPTDEHYKNGITEAWLEMAKKIRNKSIILPNDTELKMQLLSRQQRLNSSGKLELESKETMRSRGHDSPDRADSIAMLFIKQSADILTNITVYTPQPKQYSYF